MERMYRDLARSVRNLYISTPGHAILQNDHMYNALRHCDKIDCFLNGDYESLWYMEMEELTKKKN